MKKLLLLFLSVFCISSLNAQITDYVTDLSNPVAIAKNGNTLYIGSVGDSKILQVDMTASNPIAVDFINDVFFPTEFVIVGNEMYLTYGISNVGKIDLTSSNPEVTPILSGLNFVFGIAQKDNFIYVSERSLGDIIRFDYTQTNPTVETVVTGLGTYVQSLAFDGNNLYVGRGGDNLISKLDITQTNPTIEDVISAPAVLDLTMDNGFLYYGNNYLSRINLTDATPTAEVLLTQVTSIWDIYVDGTDILLAQQTDDKISKLNLNPIDVPQNERDALLALYNATNGNNWTNNENWNTILPVSTWNGITTAQINGQEHVTAIWIQDNNLTGILPGEMENLELLTDLVLDLNNLEGFLPSQLSNIDNLFRISLFGNNITGNIPPEYQLLNNLQVLNLGSNQLSGSLSGEIGNFSSLTFLSISTNSLTGNLPQELGNLSNLTILSLGNNQFSGGLPSTIGQLTNLIDLDLRNSGISSSIPSEIGNMSNLSTINLQDNNLTGSLPAELANNVSLFRINVQNNNMTGTIPTALTSLPNLNELRIENNNFQFGDFETDFNFYQSNLTQFIYSPQQQLTPKEDVALNIGESFTFDANTSGTLNTYFWFKRNPITGGGTLISTDENFNLTINSVSDYGDYWLEVTNSQISGLVLSTVDFTVGQRPNTHPDYNALVAIYNASTGDVWNNNTNWLDNDKPISSWYGVTEINNRVSRLDLNTNQLQGTIPPEIGDLTFLDYLDLRSNFLNGNLPTELGNLQNATWFDFRFNQFEGSIPNSLTTIPNLFVFIVSNNNLSGDIPDFSNQALNNLDFLWVDNNQFVFADFENEYFNYNTNIATGFIFDTQQSIDVAQGIVVDISNSILLETLTNLGTNLNIDWYRTDASGSFIFLANGLTYNLTVNSTLDYGDYYYFVTSNIVPSLGLLSQPITIGPDPSTHPDYDALIALYNALDGSNWNNPWDVTKPINTWDTSFRLQFDPVTNRVTDFEYSNAGLSGIMPPEIGDLTALRRLWVFGNNITGELPVELWTLNNLTELIIGSQQSGSAYTPGDMALTNGIPPEISNLQQLEWLNLNGIQLTLPLQQELFNLPNLFRLRLQDCAIAGQLPAGLANIDDVRVERNEFNGTLPPEIINAIGNLRLAVTNNYFDFSDLEALALSNNYQFIEYSPQRTQDIAENIISSVGADITLNVNDTDVNRESNDTAMNNIYQWYKDDVLITEATNNTYTLFNAQVNDSGDYNCEITNSILPDLTIVRAPITVTIDASLTVASNSNETEFSFYPNPVKNWLNINFGNTHRRSITIADVSGKIILNQKNASNLLALDVSTLSNGLYFLNISSEGKNQVKKFIKQ